MKKIIGIILLAVMLVGFSGCGINSKEELNSKMDERNNMREEYHNLIIEFNDLPSIATLSSDEDECKVLDKIISLINQISNLAIKNKEYDIGYKSFLLLNKGELEEEGVGVDGIIKEIETDLIADKLVISEFIRVGQDLDDVKTEFC